MDIKDFLPSGHVVADLAAAGKTQLLRDKGDKDVHRVIVGP